MTSRASFAAWPRARMRSRGIPASPLLPRRFPASMRSFILRARALSDVGRTKRNARSATAGSSELPPWPKLLPTRKHKPQVFVCSSAIGYYGDRGSEVLNEQSEPGIGFLPDVCSEWEAATWSAIDAGIRTVQMRTGIVLSPTGGALRKDADAVQDGRRREGSATGSSG